MPDTIKAGEQLTVNQSLVSNNGRYTLVMQGDGNLVGYEPGRAFWDTGTWSLPAQSRPDRVVLQQDSNLVLYTPDGRPQWDTGTWTHNVADCRLVMQDDRNIVIYTPDGTPIWASATTYQSRPEVRAERSEGVGYKKHMSVSATLYRNGSLGVETFVKNDNWTGGLRGRALIAFIDGAGRAIWVSEPIHCSTACSIWDASCASYRRENWWQQHPEPAGRFTERLDIYMGDNFNAVDLRNQMIAVVKGAKDVYAELAPFIAAL